MTDPGAIDLRSATEQAFAFAVATAVHRPERVAAVGATSLLDTEAEMAFDALSALAAELMDAPFAFVTIVDDERSFWKSCFGVDGDVRQNAVGESFCQYVIGLDGPLLIGDARTDPRTADNPSIASMGVIAWAGHPIRDRTGEVLGTFCVVDTRVRDWTDTHGRILETLAGAVVSEIEYRSAANAADASRADAELLAERATLLGSMARTLSSAVRTNDVCQLIVDLSPRLVDATVATLALASADQSGFTLFTNLTAGAFSTTSVMARTSSSPIVDAIRTGQSVFVPDMDDQRRRYPDLVAATLEAGVVSTLSEPLIAQDGTVVGALGFAWPVEHQPTPSEIGTIEAIIGLCTQTIERAVAVDEKIGLVEQLQRQLLRPVPPLESLDIAVRYLPAHGHLGLGGDWYDVFRLDDRRTIVVVGDVVGHGVEAAASMAQLQGVLHAVIRLNTEIGSIFTMVEEALAHLDDGYLATIDLFVIDADAHEIQHVSAGHPPPVLSVPGRPARSLNGGRRTVLGLPAGPGPVERIDFPPGAVLVAFTDGLIERPREPIDIGVARLATLVDDHQGLTSDQLAEILLAEQSAIAVRRDDVAVVVVTHQPPA